MKKLLLATAILAVLSGCSFLKDVQQHCTVSETALNVQTGSFRGCLECDSLAKVVKKSIEKKFDKQ